MNCHNESRQPTPGERMVACPTPMARSGCVSRSAFMKFNTLVLLLIVTLWSMITRSAEARRQIVPVDFIPKEPALVISEQSASITVQVPVIIRSQAPLGTVDNRPSPDVAKLGLQIWLLKADGTVVPQQDVDRGANYIGSMGTENWFVMFYFAKVPLVELKGIVFLKEGKLYSHQIATTDWRPL